MLKKLILGAMMASLTLVAAAAPAAAEPTAEVAWLNGLPQKVDICSGGNEVVSRLKYGQAKFHSGVTPGAYAFKVRQAAPGECTGKKLGASVQTFVGDADHTVVIWKPFKRLKMKNFTNDLSVLADQTSILARHMARQPAAVDVWLWEHVAIAADDYPPTFNALKRGQSSPSVAIQPGQFYMDWYPTTRTTRFSWEGYWGRTDAGYVSEAYLIGTTKKNFKVVRLFKPGVVAVP